MDRIDETLRLLVIAMVFLFVFVVAVNLAETRYQNQQERYARCIKSGVRPVTCSFDSTFKGD